MTLPTGAIESALITRYRADAVLQGLLTGAASPTWNIFDANAVPINQPFPYVAVNVITEQLGTAFTAGRDSVDSFVQVSVFTQSGASGGFATARAIAIEIYAITHRQALDLSASNLSNFFLLFQDKQEIADGITQHIPIRFKLMTQG